MELVGTELMIAYVILALGAILVGIPTLGYGSMTYKKAFLRGTFIIVIAASISMVVIGWFSLFMFMVGV